MINIDAVDGVQLLRESEARRGLRVVSQELHGVGQELQANGDHALAADAKRLRQQAEELLGALPPPPELVRA